MYNEQDKAKIAEEKRRVYFRKRKAQAKRVGA